MNVSKFLPEVAISSRGMSDSRTTLTGWKKGPTISHSFPTAGSRSLYVLPSFGPFGATILKVRWNDILVPALVPVLDSHRPGQQFTRRDFMMT